MSFTKTKNLIKLSIIFTLLLSVGIFWYAKHWSSPEERSKREEQLTLADAAKIGQASTHKLLVQIENRKDVSADAAPVHKRGDIVLIKPGDWEFSPAEIGGFLILHMNITDKQAEVLVRSLLDNSQNNSQPGANRKTLKLRRYAVDMAKIGLAEDDQKGREVEDNTFGWDVVYEKNF